MDNHLDQVRGVMFVERVTRRNATSENFVKKGTWFFVVASLRYQDFRHILPNSKLKLIEN